MSRKFLSITLGLLFTLPAFAQEQPKLINSLLQREWVTLDSEGSVNGSLGVLDEKGEFTKRPGVEIQISHGGKAIASTISEADGSFKLSGIQPGTYALTAQSEYTFATYALHVLEKGDYLSSDLEIIATSIPVGRAEELLRSHWVPTKSETEYYRVHKQDPLGSERTFSDSSKVRLRGSDLVGRVSRPGWTFEEQDLTGTVAHILKNGEVVGMGPVAKDGYFTIKNLEPGVYDLFVAGDDGLAVVGFEAIASQGVSSSDEPKAIVPVKTKLIAVQTAIGDTLCCEMVQPEITAPMAVDSGIAMDSGCATCDTGYAGSFDPGYSGYGYGYSGGYGGGVGGGGLGGGAAGGGGIGGGIGGLGGLLGIAGLATGVAALSTDDDFNGNQATTVTPPPVPAP